MDLPLARRDGLTVRALAEETLVYEHQSNKAHCLNRVTAFIWQRCDGRRSLAELARLVQSELGIDPPEEVVRLALEQLSRRHLLAQPIQALTEPQRLARRAILKKLAAAAALPLIFTMTAKPARAQVSSPIPLTCTVRCTYNDGSLQSRTIILTCSTGTCNAAACPTSSESGTLNFTGTCT